MEKLFNTEHRRWEVFPENPRIRNGQEQPVYVAEDPDECDAYIKRCDKQNQCRKILEYIDKYGSITRAVGFQLGIAELPARISEMRRDGINIKSETEKEYYPDGKYKGKHSRYFI